MRSENTYYIIFKRPINQFYLLDQDDPLVYEGSSSGVLSQSINDIMSTFRAREAPQSDDPCPKVEFVDTELDGACPRYLELSCCKAGLSYEELVSLLALTKQKAMTVENNATYFWFWNRGALLST